MEGKIPETDARHEGVKILRLYEAEPASKWPKIVIMELTADKFKEFEQDAVGFDAKYKLVPDSPISWMSPCARPPYVKKIAAVRDSTSWLVVGLKGKLTRMSCAAYPQEEEELPSSAQK
jgi:hypothetical protein